MDGTLSVMDWSSQSSDINIIEADSAGSSWQRTLQTAANIQRIALNVVQEALRTIPEDYVNKLQESLDKGVRLVLKLVRIVQILFFPYILYFHVFLQTF